MTNIKQNGTQDWPPIPEELQSICLDSDDDQYSRFQSNYFQVGHPALIFVAKTEAHVSEVIMYVAQLQRLSKDAVPFSIKSGGHGLTKQSINQNGVILDLSQMNRVTVLDAEKGIFETQCGAVWGDVAAKIGQSGLILSSGDFGDTGVGGLATAGGIGLLVRKQGLTIDRIISATVITGDGNRHVVSEEHEPDLFWALRGGSSQIGVVTNFVFQADAVPQTAQGVSVPIMYQKISYDLKDLWQFLRHWQQWLANCDYDLSSLLMITKQEGGNSLVATGTNVWIGESTDEMKTLLRASKNLEQVVEYEWQQMSYADLVKAPHLDNKGDQDAYVKNVLVDQLDAEIVLKLAKLIALDSVMGLEVRAIDGAINMRAINFNAWAHRQAKFFIAVWCDPTMSDDLNQQFKALHLENLGVYGAYSSDISQAETKRVWPSETGRRLYQIAKQYDPNQIFNQSRRI